ncbi:hypothetical protein PIB30_012265 [Stylosanthes scabra]|uniref:Uncharacterized protein n=1 Tax=Stylosanthes scabra TaxID=79078 RepID=A0ABU6W441_9FABA|nr:hypothetical protein [Stylosanthes scabra]
MASPAENPVRSLNPDVNDEEPVIVLHASDIQFGIERCSKSLIGRLLFDRSFSGATIETAMHSIWRQPDGFKVLDLGGNKYEVWKPAMSQLRFDWLDITKPLRRP